MTENNNLHFSTLAVHAGSAPDPTTNAVATPIYQTTSYTFNSVEHAANLFALKEFGNIYSRIMNPTTNVLEQRIAALEGGTAALATSSGHAAQLLALYSVMQPGKNIVAARQLYGGSVNQLGHAYKGFDWRVKWVDVHDLDGIKSAIDADTRAIFVESLNNPSGSVTDLEALAKISADAHVPLIVDNTLPTPYLLRPIEYGANVVVNSLTKFIGGQGNSIGGILVDGGNFDWSDAQKFPMLAAPRPEYNGLEFYKTFGNIAFAIVARTLGLRDLGPNISPFNAFLILNGVETLPLRMQRSSDNALELAKFLSEHPQVSWVNYAGLSSHPNYSLTKKYLPKGAGAVFTFGVKGGYDAAVKLVEATKLFSHLANVGDIRSLIIHPASTTHSQLTSEQKEKAGAHEDALRLSIGIEDIRDLVADIEQALSAASA